MNFKLLIGTDRVTVNVTEHSVSFDFKNDQKNLILCYEDIIAIRPQRPYAEGSENQVNIHHVNIQNDRTWIKKEIRVTADENETVIGDFKKTLMSEFDKAAKSRPKKLTVFINPFGGHRTAEKDYTDIMQPLFDMAKISCEVIVSERAGHMIKIAENFEHRNTDGVVILGGDGTFSEVVNGLMKKTQLDAGIDINDPNSQLVEFPKPIAIVPTGTNNAAAKITAGINDVCSATLQIIRGRTRYIDAIGSYGDQRLLGNCVCIFELGFKATSEYYIDQKLRWLGRIRYIIGYLSYVFGSIPKHSVEMTITKRDKENTACSQGTVGKEGEVIRTITTEALLIMILPWHLTDEDTKLSNLNFKCISQAMTVIVFKPTSKLQILTSLIRLRTIRPDMLQEDFIDVYEATDLKLEYLDQEGIPAGSLIDNRLFGVDGEIKESCKPEFHCRLHRNFTKIFSSFDQYVGEFV